MSAASASRRLFQRPRLAVYRQTTLRHASSTTEKATQAASDATSKAKSTATNIQSKASEGLSKVKSAAGPALSGAAKGVSNSLSRIGGRTGRLISAIEAGIPPTIYYSKVGLELSKLVFQGQRMSPPSLQTFQSYFQSFYNAVRNPTSLSKSMSVQSPNAALNSLRSMGTGEMAAAGVIFAEVVGFFTVGEMIGKMKVVGYRGEAHHEH